MGEVLGWDIGDMAESVTIHAFVRAPFDQYVHEESHFWNASGLSVKLGAEGVRCRSNRCGRCCSAASPSKRPTAPGTPVVRRTQTVTFPLYADEEAANAAGFTRRVQLVSYFPGAVDGLAAGAPVTLRGIRIGEVTGVKLEYDRASDYTPRAGDASRSSPNGSPCRQQARSQTPLENAQALVARGMRAQLQSANLLTGQKSVALVFVPDAAPAEARMDGTLIVVPAVPDQFAGIIQSASALMTKLTTMPFHQIGKNLDGTLAGANNLVNGPAMRETHDIAAIRAGRREGRAEQSQCRRRAGDEAPARDRRGRPGRREPGQPRCSDRRRRLWRQLEILPQPRPAAGAGERHGAVDPGAVRHPGAPSRGARRAAGPMPEIDEMSGDHAARPGFSAWPALAAARAPACSSPSPTLYTLAAVPGPPRAGGPHDRRAARDQPGPLSRTAADRPLDRPPTSSKWRRNDWWGEPLGAMLSRVLIEELSQRLPGSVVLSETRRDRHQARRDVEINILRLDADRDRHDRAARAGGGEQSVVAAPPDGAGDRGENHAGLGRHVGAVAAISEAVGQFADQIAAMLTRGADDIAGWRSARLVAARVPRLRAVPDRAASASPRRGHAATAAA